MARTGRDGPTDRAWPAPPRSPWSGRWCSAPARAGTRTAGRPWWWPPRAACGSRSPRPATWPAGRSASSTSPPPPSPPCPCTRSCWRRWSPPATPSACRGRRRPRPRWTCCWRRSPWAWPCPCSTRSAGCSGTPATGPRPWPPRPGRRCWPWSRPWCCTGTGRMPGPARPGRRRPAGRAGALGGDRARPGGGGGVQAVGPAGPPGPGRLDPAAGAAPAGRGRPRPPGRPGPVRARGGLAPCLAGPAPPAQLPGVRARRAVGGRRAGHGGPGGQVQVGGALLEHLLEQLGHPDRALGSSVPQPHPGRGGPPSSPSVCMPRSCALGWLLRFLPIRSERLAGGLNSGLVRCRGASRAGSPPGPG
jgi:hypothetical protein